MHEEQDNLITTNRMNYLIKGAPKYFETHVEVVKHDYTTHVDRPALKSFFSGIRVIYSI